MTKKNPNKQHYYHGSRTFQDLLVAEGVGPDHSCSPSLAKYIIQIREELWDPSRHEHWCLYKPVSEGNIFQITLRLIPS